MRLYTYVVARDFGFAPNPFFGWCTLCTCKPQIRAAAALGDWVVGTGPKTLGRHGRLVYAMEVTEILSYAEYWADPRFLMKRPTRRGSLKQAFGDNIYHQDPSSGDWLMLDSHHSLDDGTVNPLNVRNDTKAPRVLASQTFSYWGGAGPLVPKRFREFGGEDVVCANRGHRSRFSASLVEAFVAWLGSCERGYLGEPLEWIKGRSLRRSTAR